MNKPNSETNNDNNSSENDDESAVVTENANQSPKAPSESRGDADVPSTPKEKKENDDKKALFEVQCKAGKLAEFVISQTLGSKTKPSDNIEETLIRCVRSMTTKHEILFSGMLKRIKINDETAYAAFITVANELFEGDKLVVNWGRIIALYAFGGQLALYCKEKNLKACGDRIPVYVGRYAKEVVSAFVHKEGGWKKLCEEFPPEDDIDNKVWKLLTWTAVGLGIATAATFLTSH
ncbi:UNVERIFIED_CONTAM: hypothetical protein RMT77_015808 [Armadillidium vulgare]